MPGNAPYKPEQATLNVATENDQASTATSDFEAFGLVQENTSLPDPSIQWIEERVIGGDRKIFNKIDGQRVYEGGSIPVVPYDGKPLAYLFGTETVYPDTALENVNIGDTSAGSDSVDTHVLEINTSDLPPTQTIEASYKGFDSQDDFVRTFSGCAVNSGEIAMNNESELQTTLDYIAMDVSTGTSLNGGNDPETRDPWIFADTISDLTLFSTPFARVEQFSFALTNNLEQGRYIQSNDPENPYDITYASAEIEMSATITVDDDSLYQELLSPTADGFKAEIEFEKGSSDEERLKIIANECNFAEAPHEIPGDDTVVSVDVSIIPEDLEVRVEDAQTSGDSYL